MEFSADLVVAEPEIRVVPIAPTDECLILGSDGLWDGVPYQEAVDTVSKWRAEHQGSVDGVAQHLVELSIARNIQDNVTCIVLGFTIADIK
jgi:serine/threonine protein phosphatase PrpC